ncbi:polysaccharide pyruvyl transferase family protein [Neptuniibacter sp. QD57_21]|uniref:polysaccharide pyruvyl transferase family protein n=1 Tax=Neptuniibacter sp. QD57_21 TaxID=3398213 RepID=UPI0039F54242
MNPPKLTNERSPSKVGIMTFHYTTNYGAVLQTYALVRIVKSLGFNPEVIDYRPWKANLVYAKTLFLNRRAFSGILKFIRFSSFLRDKLFLTSKKDFDGKGLEAVAEQCGAVIVGSDEVWKTNSFRGFDPAFFLDFVKDDQKKISFSASVGSTKSFGQRKDEICELLSQFDAIAVRDDYSAELLADECGLDSTGLLDPTLLIDFPEFTSKYVSNDDFVLIYGKLNDKEMSIVKEVAAERGCKVYSVGYFNRDADENFVAAGVEDWLALFQSATMVYTLFYHGVIFSLKFHREVMVLNREDKSYKIAQLIKDLQLEYKACGEAGVKKEITMLSYSDKTSRVIELARTNCKNYLLEALS